MLGWVFLLLFIYCYMPCQYLKTELKGASAVMTSRNCVQQEIERDL